MFTQSVCILLIVAHGMVPVRSGNDEIASSVADMIVKAAKTVSDANPGKDELEAEACNLQEQLHASLAKAIVPAIVKPTDLPLTALAMIQRRLQEPGIGGGKAFLSQLQDLEIVTMWVSEAMVNTIKDKTNQCKSRKPENEDGSQFAFEKNVGTSRYEMVSVLGEGGYGKVYRVKDKLENGKEKALKAVDKSVLVGYEGLAAEFALAMKFADAKYGLPESFRFIPKVYDQSAGKNPTYEIMTMDVVGDTWGSADRVALLDDNSTKRIIARVFHMLKAIHKQNLAHGDVHSGNIAFGDGADQLHRLFLIDFGECSKEMKAGNLNMAARDFEYLRMAIRRFSKRQGFIDKPQLAKLAAAFPWKVKNNGDKPIILFHFFSLKEADVGKIETKMETALKEWMTEALFKAGDLQSTTPLVQPREPKTVLEILFGKANDKAVVCTGGNKAELKGFAATLGPLKYVKGSTTVTVDVSGECKGCSGYTGPIKASVTFTFIMPRPTKLSMQRTTTMTSPIDNKAVKGHIEATTKDYVNERVLGKFTYLSLTCK